MKLGVKLFSADNVGFNAKNLSVEDVHHSKGNMAVNSKGSHRRKQLASRLRELYLATQGQSAMARHLCWTVTQLMLLVSLLSSKTSLTAIRGRSWKPGDAALVEMVPGKPMCADSFSKCLPLGHSAVRDKQLLRVSSRQWTRR